MNKVLMSLIFGAFILTGTSYAQAPAPAAQAAPAAAASAPEAVKPAHHERHFDLHKTIHKLKTVKDELLKAGHEYGGHKAKAIEAIDKAIEELKAAVESEKK